MDKFEFYKEQYYKEHERSIAIENSLNLPLVVVMAVGSSLFFLLENFHYGLLWWNTLLFLFFGVLIFIVLFRVIYFLIRAYTFDFKIGKEKYMYEAIQSPKDLNEWKGKLNTHYAKNKKGMKQAEKDFRQQMEVDFIEATNFNIFINDCKRKHIAKVRKSLSIVLIFLAITSIPYLINLLKFKQTENSNKSLFETITKEPKDNINNMSKNHNPPPPPPPPRRRIKENPPKPQTRGK